MSIICSCLKATISYMHVRCTDAHYYSALNNYSWIDPLFWYGFRHTLQHKDLYSHPAEADSKYLLKTFHRYSNMC